MNFSHEELMVIWTAVSQFVSNSEEAVEQAQEHEPTSPETIRITKELKTARRLQDRLDELHVPK
jgi:hypothetical protein